jgi:hypothetical protein
MISRHVGDLFVVAKSANVQRIELVESQGLGLDQWLGQTASSAEVLFVSVLLTGRGLKFKGGRPSAEGANLGEELGYTTTWQVLQVGAVHME